MSDSKEIKRSLQNSIKILYVALEETPKMILLFNQPEFVHKESQEKWSKQEILGHLCDSAVINYRRFVNILLNDGPIQILTYPQNELVELHDYQNRHNRAELLAWWEQLNKQIVSLMEHVDAEQWNKQCILADGTPTTLRWLFDNYYLDHMIHHLKQIENR